jgi:decaprenylphospho-beta-D-ribofuranose 2-oxidase
MRRRFASLDGRMACEAEYEEPDRYRDLFALSTKGPIAARGAGISYVAASFGEGVTSVSMRHFDRILAFDAQARWIEVEAGASLGKLYSFCKGHGLVLPVQPGHPQITVGGCIAGNVHGKNQYREGLFGDHVRALRLFHPAHGVMDLSREQNPDLFALTIGGLGLTGLIVAATLSLVPLAASLMDVQHLPTGDIDEAFAAVSDLRASQEMVYAWIDLADLQHPGRGYVVAATSASGADADGGELAYRQMDPSAVRVRPRLLTRRTLPMINRLYRYLGTRQQTRRHVPRTEILFPALGKELYFNGYGRVGFVELQALVPETAVKPYAARVLALVRKHECPIGLATLKAFRGVSSLLYYTGNGFSFTIDVPADSRSMSLLADLDALNCEVGAVTAVIKDSRLSAEMARRQYPEFGRFRERLHAFDPARRFASALSRRLEL